MARCNKGLVIVFIVTIFLNFHNCGKIKGSRPKTRLPSHPHTHAPHPTYGTHTNDNPPPPGFRIPTSSPNKPPPPGFNIPNQNQQVPNPVHVTNNQNAPSPGFHVPNPNQPHGQNAPPPGFHVPNQNSGYNKQQTGPGYGWSIPEKPGSQTHFNPSHNYPAGNGPTKVKIENHYNYHYPGHYSLPMQNPQFPGYYSQPSYNYAPSSLGSGALGFFLGYSLGHLTTPTFSHQSFYDGYRPRYDHYEVHHYYHNKDAVSKDQEINSNNIVPCIGDTPQVCPGNTTALCTSNGALMCVANIIGTVPCLNNNRCVKSEIACVNKTVEECKDAQKNTTSINLPCISNAKIHGNITFINNTIVPEGKNLTQFLSYAGNVNVTQPNNNSTTNSTSIVVSDAAVTTTPAATTTMTIITTTESHNRRRRSVEPIQNFCVTILALPAKKVDTEGEKVFTAAASILGTFMERVWGL